MFNRQTVQLDISQAAFDALLTIARQKKMTVSQMLASVIENDLVGQNQRQQAKPKTLAETAQETRAKAIAGKITSALIEGRSLSFG